MLLIIYFFSHTFAFSPPVVPPVLSTNPDAMLSKLQTLGQCPPLVINAFIPLVSVITVVGCLFPLNHRAESGID